MSAKNETVFEGLWYVLLQLNGTDAVPDFYVFHSSVIGPWLHEDHYSWLSKPKKNGEPRKDSNMRPFRPSEEDLEKARDNWGLMFSG